ncbi:MAG TPA: tripartite tricarboxylate transporter substrate-binding protein [Burkholderiaceae bacterium]|nr:tripartite tricarboxylate transporter substrate-binding protein [Burkholderiaceae bacterium]
MKVRVLLLSALWLAFFSVHMAAEARDTFPDKPVKLIVPYGPTASNTLARELAQLLSQAWKQGVVVENITGAGGLVGTQVLRNASPDGYTLGVVASSHSMSPALNQNVPFDPIADFTPIALLGSVPLVLVSPAGTYDSLPELLKQAKSRPGALTFGSTGVGSVTHLSIELLLRKVNAAAVHVPYRGAGPLLPDLITGRVTLAALSIAVALPQIEAGKLTALAVTSGTRAASLPNTPTVSETVGGYAISPWIALLAPRGVPMSTSERIREDLKKIVDGTPSLVKRMREQGIEVSVAEPGGFWADVAQEVVQWKKVAEAAGIQPE